MGPTFIANDFPALLALDDPKRRLKQALEDIVTQRPPNEQYLDERLSGLWAGPTGFAHLFLHVSKRYPRLEIKGELALTWASRYMAGARGELSINSSRCGIVCEKLAFEAVQACITQDLGYVREFISSIPHVVEQEDFPDEILQGRAGTLYLLRMIRAWVTDSAALVEQPIQSVTEAILAHGPEWVWYGRRYLGAVHGDIGIVAQLVLTNPSLAKQMEEKMAQLLAMQRPDGNWPIAVGIEGPSQVQFCHGAPGFLFSLMALRPYFPGLQGQIDVAIENGRQRVWKEGLLVKEPSLCHGIFGNALQVLPQILY